MPDQSVNTKVRHELDAMTTMADRLLLPFTSFPQYKSGLIDEKGNLLKKRSNMTPSEKNQLTVFDLTIINTKKLMDKIAGADKKFKKEFAKALVMLQKDIYEGYADETDVAALAEEMNIITKTLKEFLGEDEAAAVSIGNNAIKQEPVKATKRSKFGNVEVFHLESDDFHKIRTHKRNHEKYSKLVSDSTAADEIRSYSKKNPGKSIMIHDEKLGAYTILKLGKKHSW